MYFNLWIPTHSYVFPQAVTPNHTCIESLDQPPIHIHTLPLYLQYITLRTTIQLSSTTTSSTYPQLPTPPLIASCLRPLLCRYHYHHSSIHPTYLHPLHTSSLLLGNPHHFLQQPLTQPFPLIHSYDPNLFIATNITHPKNAEQVQGLTEHMGQ